MITKSKDMSWAARFFMRCCAWAFFCAAVCGFLPVALFVATRPHWHRGIDLKHLLHAPKTNFMRSGLKKR